MSFDLIAPYYRSMEWLLAGNKLQHARVALLGEIQTCRNVLLVGEGHGRFLVECIRRFPSAEITCVDASRGMLEQARRRYNRSQGNKQIIHFVHATLPKWVSPRRKFDLIVTDFFFDCFTWEELALVIRMLAEAATPDARWLVAEFQEPIAGWRRRRAQIILRLAYSFFRVVTDVSAHQLPRYEDLMKQCGFRLERRVTSNLELLVSEMWSNA